MFGWFKNKKSSQPKKNPFVHKSSSFVFTRNGRTVYEERDGKVIVGTPEDKAECERFTTDLNKEVNKVVSEMEESVTGLFASTKGLFEKVFPSKPD